MHAVRSLYDIQLFIWNPICFQQFPLLTAERLIQNRTFLHNRYKNRLSESLIIYISSDFGQSFRRPLLFSEKKNHPFETNYIQISVSDIHQALFSHFRIFHQQRQVTAYLPPYNPPAVAVSPELQVQNVACIVLLTPYFHPGHTIYATHNRRNENQLNQNARKCIYKTTHQEQLPGESCPHRSIYNC